jgi:transglutaminase/protease-like cytokinesis protein 3
VQIEPRSQSKCGNCGSRDALIEKLQKENAAKNKKIVELQQQVERQNEMLEKAMRKLRDSEERTKLQENRVPQTPANVSRPRMSVLSVRR